MLARLSIRDIILIDRLDIEFTSGLSVLTGETGAGKSILLDAFALALGARGDVALVRQGAEQGQVTAAFELPSGHPVRALMAENDIPAEDELILRRVQFADGRTRAFVNDQPLSAQALKVLGMALVEIHGQHDERALVDTAAHRRLLDAFGALDGKAAEVERLWNERRARAGAVAAHRAEVERAQREAAFLRHAVEERLFALRAAARKYNVPVDGLNALAARYGADLGLIDAGAERLAALEAAARAADAHYREAAAALSRDRKTAAASLDRAVNDEL